jgi:hypothetical protein
MDAVQLGRIVLVLGEEPCINLEPLVLRASTEGRELVVLSLGWPVSEHQYLVLNEALDLGAANGRVRLHEQIVLEDCELRSHINPGDEVLMACSEEERQVLRQVVNASLGRVEGLVGL